MIASRNAACLALFLGLATLAAGEAQAGGPGCMNGGPGCGFGGFGAYGFNWNGFAYNTPPYPWPFYQHSIPTPPYFSLHPPVYYTYPVGRTYGYSPYPYPGSYPTPEVELAKPETIRNPHVEPLPQPANPQEGAKRASGKVAAQIVINPFVEPRLAAQKP